MENKYTYGDMVKILKCYHPLWAPDGKTFDMNPKGVGKEGVIAGINKDAYSIHFNGDTGPTSWFYEWQMEKI